MLKWGLQMKKELNNYQEIIEKVDELLKGNDLGDRNKRIESEKKEEELKMQKRYNGEKLIEKIKFQMCNRI